MTKSHILQRVIKTTHKATVFPTRSNQGQAYPDIFTLYHPLTPTANQEQAYTLMYFLPAYLLQTHGQAHTVQLGETDLFRGVKTGDVNFHEQ